jgi:cytoskeleton protein RodZ
MTEPEAGLTAPDPDPQPVSGPAADPATDAAAAAPAPAAEAAVQRPQTAGGMLQHIRETSGLARADVAGKLKFSVKQIETLESDNYAALGGPTFVRGLVRTYAKLLDAESGPILAALDRSELPPETGQVAADRKGIPFPTTPHTVNPILRYVVISLGVIAAGILLLYFWHGEELLSGPTVSLPAKRPASVSGVATAPASTSTAVNLNPTLIDAPPATAPASTPASTPIAASTPAPAPAAAPAPLVMDRNLPAIPASPAKPQAAEKTADKTEAGKTEAANKANDNRANAKAVAKAAEKAEQPAAKPAAAVVTGSGGGSVRRILLAFARDSWVEIKDANGRTLFSQLNLAGTQQVIEGRAPFEVVIGNAAYVTLHYREAPVDLKPYTKAEVARLSLN